MLERIRIAERWLLAAERWLLIAFVLVMVVLSFLQVILRGFFSFGLLWADTFLRHLVLWVAFLGASVAAVEDKQFAMDAAARILKGRVKAGVMGITYLFTFVVCVLLSSASIDFFKDEYAAQSTLFSIGELHLPAWVFEIIIPAGFILLALHYLLRTAAALTDLVRPATGGDTP